MSDLRSREASVHSVLAYAFASLDEAAVRWALLRDPEGGLSAPASDIDLLVHPNDLGVTREVLGRCGFGQLPRHHPGSYHFLHFSAETDRWLWLHIDSTVGFGLGRPVALEGERSVLRRRVLRDGVQYLEDDAAFWLLLWHCLAGNGVIAERHRVALTRLCAGTDAHGEVASEFASAVDDPTMPTSVVDHVRDGDWAGVTSYASSIRRTERGRARGSLVSRIGRRLLRTGERLRNWRRYLGLTVAVLGPDGAGKSTLVEGLRTTVPLPTQTIYMGLTGGALERVRKLPVPGVRFGLLALVIWGRYIRGQYHRARGRLVIFDRYIYDAAVPHPDRLTWLQLQARKLSGRLCPGPDLVILLDAPGAVMFGRKGEYSAETLEDWRSHFRSLEKRLPRILVVDASGDAATVRVEAVSRIWGCYADRWAAFDAT